MHAAALLAVLFAIVDSPCTTRVAFPTQRTVTMPFTGTGGGVFFVAHVNGSKEPLQFYFDSGAGRSMLDRSVAKRLGVRITGSSTIGGAGSGRVPVDVATGGSIAFAGVQATDVTWNVSDLGDLAKTFGHPLDGIIGFDLLCNSVVTIDFAGSRLTFASPDSFAAPSTTESLPLDVIKRWPYVHAQLKVPGQPAVDDRFVLDTGSSDDVDHPIIKQSSGPLRRTKTGNGIGQPVEGAIGETEWLRLGHTKIGPTRSVCCSGNPDDDRVIGNGILSRFVVTFDYPHQRLLLAPTQPATPRSPSRSRAPTPR